MSTTEETKIKYEYSEIILKPTDNKMMRLNQLGAYGWEIIDIYRNPVDTRYLLKKVKK